MNDVSLKEVSTAVPAQVNQILIIIQTVILSYLQLLKIRKSQRKAEKSNPVIPFFKINAKHFTIFSVPWEKN